ncbi:NmrA family NAD(P)-binding protein [Flavobacterium pectinovorum]|uniref:NmrA family NAD(P)-binding protein n=1 Tax=Flavobacterium pectinovorum TaxID=29533 RepID=UPI00265F93F2|nr:NmrA family NAD(P)-binding protein [Flavobacterium pectinovorum]WKL49593.1 NmrA family NAD(P)-binding protein [Flavobacterium pectinovorum]
MKIVITGSLGNISRPLITELVKKEHLVTVISSNPERQQEIEALGATAAIGTMENVDFLSDAFQQADVVYCMITNDSKLFFDPHFDLEEYYSQIGNNYKRAIEVSGVKRVIYLSTNGAHTNVGNGNLRIHYNVENILRQLPNNVSITFIRAGGFYHHLLSFIPAIKTKEIMESNYGGNDVVLWVSPLDIAASIAEEIEAASKGRNIRYVVSDELSGNDVAGILGESIGKPDLKWELISDEQVLDGMIKIGMNPDIAKGFMEMFSSIHTGELYVEYYRNRPVLGKNKVKDFAAQFAKAYNK